MFISNPEFLKNLKLEFNASRILIPFLLLVLSAWIGWASHDTLQSWEDKPLSFYKSEGLYHALCTFGFFFTIIWGTYLTSASLMDEANKKTWDFVRMSSLTPWQILSGKIFGAASVVWMITIMAVIPLMVFACTNLLPEHIQIRSHTTTILVFIATLFFWQVLSYGIALFGGLSTLQRGAKTNAFAAVILVFGIGLFLGGMTLTNFDRFTQYFPLSSDAPHIIKNPQDYLVSGNYYMSAPAKDIWYGVNMYVMDIFMMTLGFAAFWVIVGTYRLLRKSLLYKDSPNIWIAFLISISVFLNGFALDDFKDAGTTNGMFYWPAFCGLVAMTFTVLSESGDIVKYKSFAHAVTHKDGRESFRLLPLWVISFILFAVSAFISLCTAKEFGTVMIFFGSIMALIIRDLLVLHIISWTAGIRRPVLGMIIYMAVMYGLAPAIAATISPQCALMFYPIMVGMKSAIGQLLEVPSVLGYIALHGGLIIAAAMVFARRWRLVFQPQKD